MKAIASAPAPPCAEMFPEIFRSLFISKTGGVSSRPNSTRNSSSIHQSGRKTGTHNNNNKGNANVGFPIDPYMFTTTTTTRHQTKDIIVHPVTMRIANPGSLPFLPSRATTSPVVPAGFRRCLPVPVPTVEPPRRSSKKQPSEEDTRLRRLVGEMRSVPPNTPRNGPTRTNTKPHPTTITLSTISRRRRRLSQATLLPSQHQPRGGGGGTPDRCTPSSMPTVFSAVAETATATTTATTTSTRI
jgi:hypothetical protein